MDARWWDRLSGAELRARLAQRGVDPEDAAVLVDSRDRSPAVRRLIDAHLAR